MEKLDTRFVWGEKLAHTIRSLLWTQCLLLILPTMESRGREDWQEKVSSLVALTLRLLSASGQALCGSTNDSEYFSSQSVNQPRYTFSISVVNKSLDCWSNIGFGNQISPQIQTSSSALLVRGDVIDNCTNLDSVLSEEWTCTFTESTPHEVEDLKDENMYG